MSDLIPPLRLHDEQPIQTDLKLLDDLFVKIMRFRKGAFIPQHSHSTPHISLIGSGAVRAWKDGTFLGEFRGPTCVRIEAHSKHMFEALADDTTVFCIHAVDDGAEPDIHELHEPELV